MSAAASVEDVLIEQLMFGDLMKQKVEVRGPCSYCKAEGEKNGDPCPVCRGDREVTQATSLYKIAKLLAPVIAMEVLKRLKEEG